jgi:hypothetical protein
MSLRAGLSQEETAGSRSQPRLNLNWSMDPSKWLKLLPRIRILRKSSPISHHKWSKMMSSALARYRTQARSFAKPTKKMSIQIFLKMGLCFNQNWKAARFILEVPVEMEIFLPQRPTSRPLFWSIVRTWLSLIFRFNKTISATPQSNKPDLIIFKITLITSLGLRIDFNLPFLNVAGFE